MQHGVRAYAWAHMVCMHKCVGVVHFGPLGFTIARAWFAPRCADLVRDSGACSPRIARRLCRPKGRRPRLPRLSHLTRAGAHGRRRRRLRARRRRGNGRPSSLPPGVACPASVHSHTRTHALDILPARRRLFPEPIPNVLGALATIGQSSAVWVSEAIAHAHGRACDALRCSGSYYLHGQSWVRCVLRRLHVAVVQRQADVSVGSVASSVGLALRGALQLEEQQRLHEAKKACPPPTHARTFRRSCRTARLFHCLRMI